MSQGTPLGQAGTRPGFLEVSDLTVAYQQRHAATREVVHQVSLAVQPGRRTALVGESGSGKSVTARAILQLDTAAHITGSVKLDGQELIGAGRKDLRQVRGARIGLVLQDPLASLNPTMPIGWQIMQPLVIRGVKKKAAKQRGIDMLRALGVADAAERFGDFPHQFSGGMRQRVVIAIALVGEPQILIADEPTTALDVRVQAQVLDLLDRVTRERDMGVLFITHDLGIVAGFADDVIVMRRGEVVERAGVMELFSAPRHPYTKGLLGAVPRVDMDPSHRLVSVEEIERDAAAIAAGLAEAVEP
ncbi:MAG: ABC transporter ATP-binding protein [Bifidobacteriaceae bacterium]|jgi:ABC-type dipeptide/oligopeptide/nickel transport system ATPase component|nr:ABC transporter ATP-binding protein [Bifidobacteriaceae bacterium]